MEHQIQYIREKSIDFSRLALIVIVSSLLALSACSPTPTAPDPAPPQSPQELEEQAQTALQGEDFKRAAELYDAAADAHEDPAKAAHALLMAAENWIQVNEVDAATTSIAGVNPNRLKDEIAPRFWLIRAKILLSHEQPNSASQQLDFLYGTPEGLEKEYYTLRSRVAKQRSNRIEQARHLIAREEFLPNATERDKNRESIWKALNEVPSQALQKVNASDTTLAGWIKLVLISRQHQLDPPRLEQAIDDWQDEYPDHPAAGQKAQELLTQLQERYKLPRHIALLLPLSGDYATAGKAIREGVLAAYYATDIGRPAVTVYDTGGDPKRVAQIYRRAVEDGAEHVIGPLTKGGVRSLIDAVDQLSVPVLALNSSGSQLSIPEQMIQFGLSPEIESEQAALQARQRGWKTVVSLTPDNDWGKRIANAFAKEFKEAEGFIVESASYDPSVTDFSNPIRDILNLDSSHQRFQQISNLLGASTQYQPRRRKDIDGIFIAAFPKQARLIKPQLNFHHAQNLPVISTSHVYSGTIDPENDRDLNGIIFVDAPWLVGASSAVPQGLSHGTIEQHWQHLMDNHSRFMALGIDAYRLVPYLEVMQENPDERLDGLTGQLYLSNNNTINRGLVSARFVKGKPVFEMPTREGQNDEQITTSGPLGDGRAGEDS